MGAEWNPTFSDPIAASLVPMVRNGALLLDVRKPEWWQHVDPDHLNMSSDLHCILGQIYGYYVMGAFTIGLDPYGNEIELHGFAAGRWDFEANLRAVWCDLIAHRRREHVPA